MGVSPTWDQPSHPSHIRVIKSEGFSSGAVSLVSLPPGALFAPIVDASPAAARSFTTVQSSRDENIELNSDLVYCNHSCVPSLVFDMAKSEVRVLDDKPLQVGESLTFFYPSTEWRISQSFDCECGAPDGKCKGWIVGAGEMEPKDLEGYWLNAHIQELLGEKGALINGEADAGAD